LVLASDASNQVAYNSLTTIKTILAKYSGCESVVNDLAVDDPLVCQTPKTITFPVPASLPNLVVNPGVNPTPDCTPYITNNGCYNGWSAQSGAPQVIEPGAIRLTGQRCNVVSSAVGGTVTLPDGLVPGKKYRFSVTYRANTLNDNVYCQFFKNDGYLRTDGSIYGQPQVALTETFGCAVPASIANPPNNIASAPNFVIAGCQTPMALNPNPVSINGNFSDRVWFKQGVPQDALTWKTDEVVFTATDKSTHFVFTTIPTAFTTGVTNSTNLTTWGSNGTFESGNDGSIQQMFFGINTRGTVINSAAKSAANGLSITNNVEPQSKGGTLLK
ncbi:MAG: hypothetical protein ACKO96_00630, partial [Flammeovirgaceae bacterium]